jgi:hypothetical protein
MMSAQENTSAFEEGMGLGKEYRIHLVASFVSLAEMTITRHTARSPPFGGFPGWVVCESVEILLSSFSHPY